MNVMTSMHEVTQVNTAVAACKSSLSKRCTVVVLVPTAQAAAARHLSCTVGTARLKPRAASDDSSGVREYKVC